MKCLRWLVLPAALLIVLPPIDTFAQERRVVRQLSADDVKGEPFNIAELGALVLNMKDTLKVLAVSPGNMRPKAYESVDLKENDVIVMVNGKRAQGTEDLSAAYAATEIGKSFELGIKRDGKMMLVSFAKADEKDLPKRQMMMMQTDTDDGKGGEKHAVMMGHEKMEVPDGITDVTPLPGLGLLAGMKENKPVIAGILPFAKDDKTYADIKPGDEIFMCAGKTVKNLAEVTAALDGVKEGEQLTLTVKRDGHEYSVSKTKSGGDGGWTTQKK